MEYRRLGKSGLKLSAWSLGSVAWCLKNPDVSTAIFDASRLEQLEENLVAVERVSSLGPEVMARIEAAVTA